LDLKLSSENVKPGAKISIECKTIENSFISLLGVDQSVTLLGSGNDIDNPRIAAELNTYNAHETYPALKVKGNKENRYADFGESNAFIMTNALDGTNDCRFVERGDGVVLVTNDDDDSGLDFSSSETDGEPDNRVRKNFPETWLFEEFEADDNGKHKYEATVPDTITSFIVTGFAVHSEKGLGVAQQKKVKVFQDFFLKLYLPYSVRLGEILKIEVTVFNYVTRPSRPVTVTVEMANDDGEFDFVDTRMSGSECVKTPSRDQKRSKTITVPSGSGASTFFLIKTLATGQIKLKVKATSPNRKDAVEKLILVEHEGLKVNGNIPKLFNLRTRHDAHHVIIPLNEEKIINNSISIEASAIGDLLGPAMQNIHNLM
jgi:CD109 antigen